MADIGVVINTAYANVIIVLINIRDSFPLYSSYPALCKLGSYLDLDVYLHQHQLNQLCGLHLELCLYQPTLN